MNNPANNDIPVWTPVCQVCKASNETLRAVSYPYVVSVLVMTFQRAFSGIFCAKHQRRYHLLASLITSLAGWLGIPFGFILTPITLLKLARGGVTNDRQNIQLLAAIADKKLSEGDTQGAIRCLEECIKLQDVPEIRTRLASLYQVNRTPTEINNFETVWQFISIPALLLGSSIAGLLLGLFDLLLGILLSPLYEKSGTNLIVAILSWLPTVTMLFVGILIVRAMLRWTLSRNKRTSMLLGSVLAYVSTFLAFYSDLQGQALLRNLYGVATFFTISRRDGIFAVRSVLTHGGADVLINNFSQADLPNIIFAILLIAAIGLSLFAGLEMVLHTVKGQQRLFQIRESLSMEMENPSVFAWGTLSVMVLGLILFLALAFPGKYVNIENVYREVNLGMTEMDQNHYDEAINHFNNAVDLWDTSATNHMFLGVGYYSQDKYEQGMEELDISLNLDPDNLVAHLGKGYNLTREGRYREALDEFTYLSKSRPEWGLPHAALAVTYYTLDEMELADKEIQTALAYEKDDAQTSSIIASYYAQTLDFKKAEEHILKAIKASNNGDDYVALARIYVSQNKFDQAEKAIEEASRQGADPVSVYLAKLRSAEFQNDLEAASAILAEAIKLYPNQSDLLSENSYVLFQKGQIDQSARDAEKAVQINPYNASGYIEEAFAYHAQGRLDEALQAAKRGVSLSPKQDRAHYILGLCYMDLGMKKEAVAEFETFLKVYWERPLVKEYKENVLIYLEQLK